MKEENEFGKHFQIIPKVMTEEERIKHEEELKALLERAEERIKKHPKVVKHGCYNPDTETMITYMPN